MSRRALTFFLATLLALGLGIAGGFSKVDYVSLGPGPVFDTLGGEGESAVLAITGAKTYPTDGTLSLTTVSVRDKLTLFEALYGWISTRQAVIPREIVYPPDQTEDEQRAESNQQMRQSQDAATTAALRELGIPAKVSVAVGSIKAGAPADGKLKEGDVVTSVDGATIGSAKAVGEAVRKHAPGETVRIGYTRNGKAATVTLTTARSDDEPVRAIIGVTPSESASFPIKVDIRLKEVGGPSAGLMFALGIIDKLGPESLTGGRKIAGTGEITNEGVVGPIGGIAEKLIGAKDQGATVFLVPAQNCAEARSNRPDDLTLVKVETLKGALAALKALREGGSPPSC